MIPKQWQIYYTVKDGGAVENRLYQGSKEDMFNVLTQNCYHTEAEASAKANEMQKRLDYLRDRIGRGRAEIAVYDANTIDVKKEG